MKSKSVAVLYVMMDHTLESSLIVCFGVGVLYVLV